jgi:hypothetical protein
MDLENILEKIGTQALSELRATGLPITDWKVFEVKWRPMREEKEVLECTIFFTNNISGGSIPIVFKYQEDDRTNIDEVKRQITKRFNDDVSLQA